MESDGRNRNQKILAAAKHLHAAKQFRRGTGFLGLSDVRWLIRELKPTMEEGPCQLPPDDELARIGFAAVQDLDRIRRQAMAVAVPQKCDASSPKRPPSAQSS
jgi:hypothetical protein